MKKKAITLVSSAAATAALCIALSGCSAAGTSVNATNTNSAASNDQYMSQVNQSISDLDTKLDDFVDAVSRGDTVGMRTQADRAMKTLDTLEGLTAGDDIADVKQKYDEGCESLKAALNEYVTLYTSGATITQESLASAQQKYDAGVAALKDADAKASSKE